MINLLEWEHCGDKHKLYRKDLTYLKLLAYGKTFYYPIVKLNGILIKRSF